MTHNKIEIEISCPTRVWHDRSTFEVSMLPRLGHKSLLSIGSLKLKYIVGITQLLQKKCIV